MSQWQDDIRPINNYMHPADKEIQRLVMPLCGTRTFASKMREQLCYVDEDGHLQPRRDVQWPAFLRYNASKILTKYGKNAQGNNLWDLLSLPAEKVCAQISRVSPGVPVCLCTCERARARVHERSCV